MKRVLFWTLKREWDGRYALLGVTSAGPRGRINGRYADQATTHCRIEDTVGQFTSMKAAQDRITDVQYINDHYDREIGPLQRQIDQLNRSRQADIAELLEKDK